MKKEKIYWIMKNGEKIDVDDMTENHLRNTLKMIINNTNLAIKNEENQEPYCDDWMWK